MARYDYRCTACDKVFEVEHGMREHPEVTCPDCGAAATRVLSASGIVFKGSGFYNTDERGKKGGTAATSGSSAEAADKPAKADGAKAAATPDASPAPKAADTPASSSSPKKAD